MPEEGVINTDARVDKNNDPKGGQAELLEQLAFQKGVISTQKDLISHLQSQQNNPNATIDIEKIPPGQLVKKISLKNWGFLLGGLFALLSGAFLLGKEYVGFKEGKNSTNKPRENNVNLSDTIVNLQSKLEAATNKIEILSQAIADFSKSGNSSQLQDPFSFKASYNIEFSKPQKPDVSIRIDSSSVKAYFKLEKNKHRGYFILTRKENLYFTSSEKIFFGAMLPCYKVPNCVKLYDYTTYTLRNCPPKAYWRFGGMYIYQCDGIEYNERSVLKKAFDHWF